MVHQVKRFGPGYSPAKVSPAGLAGATAAAAVAGETNTRVRMTSSIAKTRC